MRVNAGGPRISPGALFTTDYAKSNELAKHLTWCIESFKEMAGRGGKVGVKVTLEKHSSLTANPMNIGIEENDIGRSVRIMMTNAKFMGMFGLEYEDGAWHRAEGAKYLYNEVLAAL